MARVSKIEWCDSTWSPWRGCTEISDGCRKCWARAITRGGGWGKTPRIPQSAKYWRDPLEWNADAPRFKREHGRQQRVFGGHVCDWFDNQVPDEWHAIAWRIVRQTPNLVWLILTKRPQNIPRMLPPDWGDGYANVWLGISVEDAARYVQRWPILSRIPAALRFVSYEPALGPLCAIDIGNGILPDWIIVGGESGGQPREMQPQWARDVRDDCASLGITFFMKQMTGKRPIPADLLIRVFPLFAAGRKESRADAGELEEAAE